MIDLGPHAAFIVWSYAGVAATVVALVLYVWWDARGVAAKLKTLEDRGIRRRSATSSGTSNT